MSTQEVEAARVHLPRRLSATGLDRFRRCEKQFWFAHVARVETKDEPSPILAQANAIHHALERFFGLPVEDRSPDTAERALRSVWCSHRKRDTFAGYEEERLYGLEAVEMLRRYAEEKRETDIAVTPLAREQWLNCRLPNGGTLYGKLDRVDPGRDGVRVVDYKTGRHELEPEDLSSETAAIVYLLLAEQAYQQPVEQISFHYLRSGRPLSWYPERDDVVALGERLVSLTDRIATSEDWPAEPGGHCRFCPWQLHCTDRQRVELVELVPVEGLPF